MTQNIYIYDGMNYLRTVFERQRYTLESLLVEQELLVKQGITVIWTWEGVNGNGKRREKYPEYKQNRKKYIPYEDIFAIINEFRELLTHTQGIYQCAVKGYEGDDVISSLVELYREQADIFIQSNDKDFRQLYVYPNIKGNSNPIEDTPDRFVRLYKTLVGDPSDNITGVVGFGPAAWEKCAKESLLSRFKEGNFKISASDGFKPAQVQRLNITHPDMLRIFWEITGFYALPVEVLNENMIVGVENKATKDQILSNYQFD